MKMIIMMIIIIIILIIITIIVIEGLYFEENTKCLRRKFSPNNFLKILCELSLHIQVHFKKIQTNIGGCRD